MNNNLFVGGLSYNTDDNGLSEHFSQAGKVVSAKVINDRYTGKSRGFGFVEMSTEEEAQKAIEMFDSKELDGRTIRVNVAKPKRDNA